ncbi:MAG: extracellular solute-binding protein [Gemmatimonadota bacterium]|nr:extracellular solute-binding protein [Gemmatimonadota bacterium]
MRHLTIAALALCLVSACGRHAEPAAKGSTAATAPADTGTLDVMNAASVTQPLRAVLDTFSARTGVRYALQPGASLELARLITETGRRPDVLLLADPEVFPKLLEPRFANGYEIIARNRIVLAYTPQSRGASRIGADNWRAIVTEPGVQVGRADPNTDPSGYRTLLAMQLAARYYHDPSLYRRLLAAAPDRNVRPREADQVALLETHQLDYIWSYQNLADENGLKYVRLPDAVDLGTPADSATYATVSTRVIGRQPGDTLTMRGGPILFAAAVLTTAPHPAAARRFLDFLMSADGQRIARAHHFDVLDSAIVVKGATSAPAR